MSDAVSLILNQNMHLTRYLKDGSLLMIKYLTQQKGEGGGDNTKWHKDYGQN